MKKYFTCLFFIFSDAESEAQSRLKEHNSIGWYTTTITPAISKKISLHAEYQWRRNNIVTDWQQSLLRVGINYKIHPQVTLHAGYGWILTYPYGDYSIAAIAKTFPEHRMYEQVVVTTTAGKANITQRLRLEQRWIGKYGNATSDKPESFTYLNRIRYMPRIDVPVNKKIYASVYDEIFIGFGKNIGENIFDQNRIAILAGYKINETFKVEAGFINQTLQLGREVNNKNVFQSNSGLLINTFINFRVK